MMKKKPSGTIDSRGKIRYTGHWKGNVIILLLIFFVIPNFYGMTGSQKMGILIVKIGPIENNLIERLKRDLERIFGQVTEIGKAMPEPDYAFNKRRNQYLSTAILNALLRENEFLKYEKTLGIVDKDLYVPDLNFVFGEATQRAAVISITRLRQEFYGFPEDEELFYKRVLTEAVHELGHTYGLPHCQNPNCVMFFSNSLRDTDRKGSEFCKKCGTNLKR